MGTLSATIFRDDTVMLAFMSQSSLETLDLFHVTIGGAAPISSSLFWTLLTLLTCSWHAVSVPRVLISSVLVFIVFNFSSDGRLANVLFAKLILALILSRNPEILSVPASGLASPRPRDLSRLSSSRDPSRLSLPRVTRSLSRSRL